jgi:hypothetical protein
MLGAIQSVDMILSLWVLDVNLLPNQIEYVVVGDRLFTLPIQVEGRDDVPRDQNMEVDNNNDGTGGSGEQEEHEPMQLMKSMRTQCKETREQQVHNHPIQNLSRMASRLMMYLRWKMLVS